MRRLLPLLLALVVAASAASLGWAYVQYGVATRWRAARDLEARGLRIDAIVAYEQVASFLDRSAWLRARFNAAWTDAQIAQLRLLYAGGEYDRVVELADRLSQEAIADRAAAYFWSGSALVQRGLAEENPADGLPWLHRAATEFRRGLEEDRAGRWNLKYNYELVRAVLDQSARDKARAPDRLLRPKPAERPSRKVVG